MTLPKKKDEELTTADIAGGATANPRESEAAEARREVRPSQGGPARADAARPQLVNPPPKPSATTPARESRGEHERSEPLRPQEAQAKTRPGIEATAAGPAPQMPEQGKTDSPSATALFAGDETRDLHGRWEKIQIAFVDEPRKAVEQADSLVATTIKRLAEIFAQERSRLEGQWGRGDDVSTEDLRLALQRYRSFFQRLLSV